MMMSIKERDCMVEDKASTDKYESIRLGNQLCFPLYACSKEVIRQYRKPLEEFDLTYTQYLVMMVLWEFGDESMPKAPKWHCWVKKENRRE